MSFQSLIDSVNTQNGITEFIAKYKSFKNNPQHKFIETEAGMNRLGYVLLKNGKAADALEIFKLNAECYPNSANVFDSLGDAY